MQGPLEYIRVLDLIIACAGQTAVRLLADWGAGVIKVRAAAAQPGESDRALLDHPRMFTYCLAEDQENSPLLPNASEPRLSAGRQCGDGYKHGSAALGNLKWRCRRSGGCQQAFAVVGNRGGQYGHQ